MSEREWINSVDELPQAGQLCEVKMILSFKGHHLANCSLEDWITIEDKAKLTPEMVFWRPIKEKNDRIKD